jgi:hypothetical protein
MEEIGRGIGRTTAQMKDAPEKAVFIWCNGALDYPKRLARDLGRTDLEIVAPSWLDYESWRGRHLTGIVVDHATRFEGKQFRMIDEARTRIRTP